MTTMTFAALVQQFFTDRLSTQMEASPNTIASYRDTFRLVLRFASERTGRAPTQLRIDDLSAELISDFLVYIESERRNSARSRNTRLAGIRSFFRFVAMTEPAYLLHCQQILTLPDKRYVRRTVEFLDRPEIEAVLAAPDRSTWVGRRDHAILTLALQTGMRVSELINLRRCDLVTGTGAHIYCEGKGRKQRCTPLRQETLKVLEAWLRERGGTDSDPLFPTIRGTKLSRDALEHIVKRHTRSASRLCPSLVGKHVSPHVLRHYLPFLTMSGNVGKHRCKRGSGAAFTRDNLELFHKTKNRHRIEMASSVGPEPHESRIHLLSLLSGRRTDAE
jgi:integrase/recombinase XerD